MIITIRTVINKWYNKNINKWIPEYALLSLIACFSVSGIVYWGSQLIMRNSHHYDLTTAFDSKIIFSKEWVLIYLGCYIFWVFNYILISREGKEEWYRFACADIFAKIICGLFYIALPTTNIRPIVMGNDIFSVIMRSVYQSDPATNLFPSLHCLVSWFCFIGIRKSKKIPSWYIIFSYVFAILVCISTQFTKQHVLIDVAGGILIAEASYFVMVHTQLYRDIERFFDFLGQKIFGVI